LGWSVRELADLQEFDEFSDAPVECRTRDAVQLAVIADVLPGAEARIETALVRQHPELHARTVAVRRHIHAVHFHGARARAQHRGDDAQRGRLAGPVVAWKVCDPSVDGGEADALY